MVVFPKHYHVIDKAMDSRALLECIAKHKQKRPETYIGRKSQDIYQSNFPFAAFWKIYEFYQSHGLCFEDNVSIAENSGARISWKNTISRSQKYIINKSIIMFPLYYRRYNHLLGFVSECMIFAIDYTVSKFGVLLDAQATGRDFPEFDYLGERKNVVNALLQLRQKTFRDQVRELIDALIAFFSKVDIGGDFYLKHYNFSAIWEDMVTEYLCKYYKGIDSFRKIIFDKVSPSGLIFSEQSFHTNAAKQSQFISPDHYCGNADTQLIFDAKYYTKIIGMNYKQIAYLFMLKGKKDPATGMPRYKATYSALILPAKKRDTKNHFRLAPEFGGDADLTITEEYLDIREVIEDYILR